MRNHIVSGRVDQSDETDLIKVDHIKDNFFVSYYPHKKKATKWIKSCLDETKAIVGMHESLSEASSVPLQVTQHFEDNQIKGDCSFTSEDSSLTWEIKMNKNALRTGSFDVELYDLNKRENSGITKSMDDSVDKFCFALQTTFTDKYGNTKNTFIDPMFRKYADRFFVVDTSTLYKTMISEERAMRYNPEKRAILVSVPINHEMFDSYPLHWNKYGSMPLPKFYERIFS
jgi:hypothetical protein